MATFASGKHSIALCDVCGFQFKLTELKPTYIRAKPTGLKTCATCFDPDHPQNFVGMQDMSDPQAVRQPRPDNSLPEIRGIVVPVYGTGAAGFVACSGAIGKVAVTT